MKRIWGFIDFDNTMMATETKALPSLVKRFNAIYGDKVSAPLTLDIFLKHFHGKARQSLCDALSTHFGIDVVYDEFMADRERNIMQLYAEEGVDMAPNIIETFEVLKKNGVILSYVSNNSVQRGMAAMRYATNSEGEKLAAFFGTRFFESGNKPKPMPDVYFHALAQVRADVRRSFAVEDSVTGVKSAVAAGLRVFGYTGLSQEDKEILSASLVSHGASDVFDDWQDFPALLGKGI